MSGFVAPCCRVDHRWLYQAPSANSGADEPAAVNGADAAGGGGVDADSGGVDADSGGEAGMRSSGAGGASGQGPGDDAGGESGSSVTAGMGSGGTNASAEGGSTSIGGSTGLSGASGAPTGGAAAIVCQDLDRDGEPDCSETLLKNASFDASFAGAPSHWVLSAGATATWDSLDSLSANSGSVVVTTSDAADGPGVDQCVALQAGKNYETYALTLTRATASTGFARISAFFFPSTDCSGDYDRVVVSPLEGTLNSWRTVHVPASPALSDRSLRIRLGVLKASNAVAISVHFDAVLLTEK